MFTQNQSNAQIAHHKPVFCLFGSFASLARPTIGVVLAAILIIPLPGCGSGGSKDKRSPDLYAEQGPGVFSDPATLNIPDVPDDSIQWSIILATLPTPQNPQLAQQILSTIQTKHGLIGAYIAQREEKTVIAYGHYEGPNDRMAILELDMVREIQSDQQSRPFASAFLAPPPSDSLGGSNAEYDLRTVKDRYGPSALYTLQLGVYGTDDNTIPNPSEIKEFRSTAERAVLELRNKGDRAFYYHAPFRSMVTMGVFGINDFDASTTPAIESLRLKELRKRFPHNYLNGLGIRETITTDTGQRVTRLQPSSLVEIPKK